MTTTPVLGGPSSSGRRVPTWPGRRSGRRVQQRGLALIDTNTRTLTIAVAIGAGLSAGVYLAFSTLVMGGLRRLTPSQAISAMNGINKAAPANPLLMLVLFGTGIGCVLLIISVLRHLGDPAASWQIAGAVLFVVHLDGAADRADDGAQRGAAGGDRQGVGRQHRQGWPRGRQTRRAAACYEAKLGPCDLVRNGRVRAQCRTRSGWARAYAAADAG